jgi:hypothetical protein
LPNRYNLILTDHNVKSISRAISLHGVSVSHQDKTLWGLLSGCL